MLYLRTKIQLFSLRIIKRIAKIFVWLAVSLLVVLLLALAVLQIPSIQNKLKNIATEKISSYIGLQVEIGRIIPIPWNGVGLKDFCVYDKENDTIAYASYLSATIGTMQLDSSYFSFEKLVLSHAAIHIVIDSTGKMNIDPLLQALQSSDTTSSAHIEIHDIEIRKTMCSYDDFTSHDTIDFGVDFSHVAVSNMYGRAHDFSMKNGSYAVAVDKFSANEMSGLEVSYLHGAFSICDTAIACSKVAIFTPDSKIFVEKCNLIYSSFSDFSDFCNTVRVDAKLNRSTTSLHDIAYFASPLQDFPYKFSIEGEMNGTVSDFIASNVHIGYGKSSEFVGNLSVKGLPNIESTKFSVVAQKLKTTYTDISQTRIPPYSEECYVPMPEMLQTISSYNFSGTVDGQISNLCANGTLTTNVGKLITDACVNFSETNTCQGNISFEDFNVGTILSKTDLLGKVTGSLHVDGSFTADSLIEASVKGVVDTIECKGYSYSGINIDTKLAPRGFRGKFSIDDPNLQLKFAGGIDMSKKIPEIKFFSVVDKARLDKLHLFDDSLANVSFSTQVDLTGADLDNMNGTASIRDFQYDNKKGSISSKNIAVTFSNENKKHAIKLRSAFADAEVNGVGNYSDLYDGIVSLVAKHISSIPTNVETKNKNIQSSDFQLSAQFKNIDTVFSLLMPELRIANGTTCNASYSTASNECVISVSSPQCSYGSVVFYNCHVDANASTEKLFARANCSLDKNNASENVLNASATIKNDVISLVDAHWQLSSIIQTTGDCGITGNLVSKGTGKMPKIVLQVQPSSFTIADSLWNISKANIVIDTTSISISEMSLFKDAKKIAVDGVISENRNDYVVMNVENFDLNELNPIINKNFVRLGGKLQGRVKIKNLYETPLVFADINSNSISFNDNELGELRLRSFWENKKKALLLNASILKDNSAVIALDGKYIPSSDSLYCTASLNEVNLKTFDEILAGTIDNLSGSVDGSIDIEGNLSSLQYSGELVASNGGFTVNYTHVPYSFNGKLKARKSRFYFSEFSVFDDSKNKGAIHGFVDLQELTNPHYRINIDSPKLLVMNTTANDNDYFYGTIYYNGTAKIEGDLNGTDISANGKSLENTVCSIPVSYSELSGAYDFLFFSSDSVKTETYERPATSSNLTMDFTLNITPDALAQIIFDPKVGDVIKARGNGNLQVKMAKDGDLKVYGKYQIEEGDYLFTLKNLINKKLILQKGGTIVWNGDPLNAQVDLTANYETKASPQPLFDSTVSASKRIAVTCQAMLKNNLMSPDISYNIAVPSSATQVNEVLATLSEDEKTLQFFSLLLQSSFMTVNSEATAGSSVSFEVLSNQFNNLLSQLDPNLDVNVNYRMGTNSATNNEFEFGFSRQFWNNRVLVNVNGYTDFGGSNTETATFTETQSSEFSGNVSVEMKLNQQGTLKVKGFSRSNDDELSEKQENTNGIGFSFTKDFNTLRDLFRREKKK